MAGGACGCAADRPRGSVTDDGRGFDVKRGLDRSRMRLHMGLDAVAERIRLANGEFAIRSTPGVGTTVEFTIPVDG
jgi:signal transduction histidine kinase